VRVIALIHKHHSHTIHSTATRNVNMCEEDPLPSAEEVDMQLREYALVLAEYHLRLLERVVDDSLPLFYSMATTLPTGAAML